MLPVTVMKCVRQTVLFGGRMGKGSEIEYSQRAWYTGTELLLIFIINRFYALITAKARRGSMSCALPHEYG